MTWNKELLAMSKQGRFFVLYYYLIEKRLKDKKGMIEMPPFPCAMSLPNQKPLSFYIPVPIIFDDKPKLKTLIIMVGKKLILQS